MSDQMPAHWYGNQRRWRSATSRHFRVDSGREAGGARDFPPRPTSRTVGPMPDPQLDHLDLGDDERALICRSCPGARVIYLAGMDKGLSGSHVWRARWSLGGALSKDHVLKIGPRTKLRREYEAYSSIASVIDPGSPHMALFDADGDPQAALRQEFATAPGGNSVSLRTAMRGLKHPADAGALIDTLFRVRMARWHFHRSAEVERRAEPLEVALGWWLSHLDLPTAVAQIGDDGVAVSLKRLGLLPLADVFGWVHRVLSHDEDVSIGPVHGDLHAQNVLVGSGGELTLIDFGWTSRSWRAVDFLMLECSLKFLVSPPSARLEDLLLVEQLLEDAVGTWDYGDWERLVPYIHGRELAKLGAALQAVRTCATESGAVGDVSQYRRGLVALTAALASLPHDINRVFLLHSLAYQAQRLT